MTDRPIPSFASDDDDDDGRVTTEPNSFLGILVPAPATLAKYGLSVGPWRRILEHQNGKCGACGTVPPSRKLNIDHQHVKGWKRMPVEQRPQFIRGLVCYMCNHYRLARGATPANLRGAADYLEDYEERRRRHG
jgi:hypothetical protein